VIKSQLILLAMIGFSFATSSCVTRQGWKQEGKTEQNLMKDDGECFAQAQTRYTRKLCLRSETKAA